MAVMEPKKIESLKPGLASRRQETLSVMGTCFDSRKHNATKGERWPFLPHAAALKSTLSSGYKTKKKTFTFAFFWVGPQLKTITC